MKNGPAYSHEEKIAIMREHEEGHKTLKQVCEKYGIRASPAYENPPASPVDS